MRLAQFINESSSKEIIEEMREKLNCINSNEQSFQIQLKLIVSNQTNFLFILTLLNKSYCKGN